MNMSIWKKKLDLDELNLLINSSMPGHLNVKFIEITADSLSARMPVDERTKQPFGILHGGASAALAETVASVASYMTLEGDVKQSVGLDLNVSHLKAVPGGFITATASPIRLGSNIQVWQIRIVNDAGDLIAFSRLTVMILHNPLEKKRSG